MVIFFTMRILDRYYDDVMKDLILTLAASAMICLLQSCANNKPVEEVKVEEEEKVDKLVARVSSVNLSANYVLIQRYGQLVVPDDSILYTLNSTAGQGKGANIKLTGEKLGQFLAADIVSGQIKVGDSVYLRDLTEVKKEAKTFTPLNTYSKKLDEQSTKPELSEGDVVKPEQVEVEVPEVESVQDGRDIQPLGPVDDTLLPIVE